MIHGYHVILPVYGFWLPNDPRGSWSNFVGKWELARFGKARPTPDRRSLRDLSEAELEQREAARRVLKYPAVQLDGLQARAVARGFSRQIRRSNYTLWACAILPEHTHLVIARHTYSVEKIVNLLKGAATRQLIEEHRRPLAKFAEPGERPPRVWAKHAWKIYLDSDEAIENAIAYVQKNPLEEDKPAQQWSFVTRFAGLPESGQTTYH